MAEPHTPNESAFGVLRIKAGPDGGAVRLGVLVRDLMKRHDMARAEAVTDLLLPRLQGDSPPALYLLQPGGNALALGDREWFQTGTGDAAWSIGAGSTIWNVKREPADSLGHGTAGAVAWLRLVWADPRCADAGMDVREAMGSFLAVSEADAAAVWGWGAARVVALSMVPVPEVVGTFPLADLPALAAYRTANNRASWADGNQRELVTAAVQDRGGNTAAWDSVAAEIGVKRQTLQTAVKRERKRKTSKVATSFPAVGQLTASNGK